MRTSHEDLLHHPDPAVQVWHHFLDGLTLEQIRRWIDFTPTRMTTILNAAPPETIALDLRYLTGQRAVRLTQSGRDALLGPDGLPRKLIALLPRQITTAAYRAGIATIEAELRDGTEGDVHLAHGGIAEGIEMWRALGMIHDHGAPAWEVDESGAVALYRRRHARLLEETQRASILAQAA